MVSMTSPLPVIKGLVPSSLIEWDGQIACALFLAGCNFRCPFCHASAIVLRPDTVGDVPLEAIVEHLAANRGWIDGVVISGGEPTVHDGLSALIEIMRSHVAAVKLDTNGTGPHVLESLIGEGLIDCVAMDIKAPLDERYDRAAGVEVDLGAISASIDLLRRSDIEREFRMTVVPGLHGLDDVVDVARALGPRERLVLQQFAPLECLDPSYLERQPFKRDQLRDMAAAARPHLAGCTVRGEHAPS